MDGWISRSLSFDRVGLSVGLLVCAFFEQSLRDAGVFLMGLNRYKSVFCETTEGRGYIARHIGEMSKTEKIALHIDDNPQVHDSLCFYSALPVCDHACCI